MERWTSPLGKRCWTLTNRLTNRLADKLTHVSQPNLRWQVLQAPL